MSTDDTSQDDKESNQYGNQHSSGSTNAANQRHRWAGAISLTLGPGEMNSMPREKQAPQLSSGKMAERNDGSPLLTSCLNRYI